MLSKIDELITQLIDVEYEATIYLHQRINSSESAHERILKRKSIKQQFKDMGLTDNHISCIFIAAKTLGEIKFESNKEDI